MDVLQFELEWVIFYIENFGHLERNSYDADKMLVVVRLIDIIQNEGGNNVENERLPYVNLKNKNRFSHSLNGEEYLYGEQRCVRFRKAYYLFFEFVKFYLLEWWD